MAAHSARGSDVRSSTRAHLMALREARLNRRKGAGAPPVDDPMTDTPALTAMEPELEPTAEADFRSMECHDAVDGLSDRPDKESPDEESLDEESLEADIAIPACAPKAPDPEAPETEGSLPEPQIETASLEEPEPLTDPAPEGPPPVALPVAVSERPTQEGLGRLPGAGPGMIWMLNEAGIMSLEDLARADKAGLSGKLGLLGDILDLDYWIDQAGQLADS
jgi:predicted flap endonuclease-1-like 5' DNA nuclease